MLDNETNLYSLNPKINIYPYHRNFITNDMMVISEVMSKELAEANWKIIKEVLDTGYLDENKYSCYDQESILKIREAIKNVIRVTNEYVVIKGYDTCEKEIYISWKMMDEFMKIHSYFNTVDNIKVLRVLAENIEITHETIYQLVSNLSGCTNCQAPDMPCLPVDMNDTDKMLYCVTKLLQETYKVSPDYYIVFPDMLIPSEFYNFLIKVAKILQTPEIHP